MLGERGESVRAGVRRRSSVVTWARETGCSRLRATVWDWNAASRRVLEKLGFRETGTVVSRSAAGCSLLARREL